MDLENAFEVRASPEDVWKLFLDVENVAACIPGAELVEVVDDRTWKGRVTVKLGPVVMVYAGTVTMTDRDDNAHRIVLNAKGTETRGKGTATARVTSTVEPTDDGSRVSILTDLTLSGAAVQYGRGMVGDVSRRLTDEFAECLRQHFLEPQAAAASQEAVGSADPRPGRPQAKPIAGIRLGLWMLWRVPIRALRALWFRLRGARSD
jgi:carbon monoxide dehydrogenase subunit G